LGAGRTGRARYDHHRHRVRAPPRRIVARRNIISAAIPYRQPIACGGNLCAQGVHVCRSRESDLMAVFRRRNAARWRAAAVAAGAACGGWLAPSNAADTWDNTSGDNKWFTATNWADNNEPTDTDAVTFPAMVPPGALNPFITLGTDENALSLAFNN